jgi:hypothetical protein
MPFNNFHLFPNYEFVETGTYLGHGLLSALESGAFVNLTSIELSLKYYEHCQRMFAHCPNVRLLCGDSRYLLWPVIKNINTPITFWLDGHWSGEDTAKGEIPFPLMDELRAIEFHPIKTHTILIDDVRLFDVQFGVSKKIVENFLLKINPNYQFSYLSGYVPEDVLLARIE